MIYYITKEQLVCLVINIQFAHFGPTVFQLSSAWFTNTLPCGYKHRDLSFGSEGTVSIRATKFLNQYLSLSVSGSG